MHIAKVMRPGEFRLEERPAPIPGPDEALVRIKAVGVCGTDLQYYQYGRIGDNVLTPGHILGHEVAGVVEALGPGVDGPAVGTRVAVNPAINCGRCRFCLEGEINFCSALRFLGSPPTPGGFQELLVHPKHFLLPLAPSTPFSIGAVIEPLSIALHAVDLGHLRPGMHVAVFGCGPIGILTTRVAQIAGAIHVSVVDPLAHRRKAAIEYGGSAAFDPAEGDIVAGIREATKGKGVDVVFDTAGSQSATDQALEVLRPGGTAVLVGYWKTDLLSLMGIRAIRKGLTLRFARRMKNTFERAVQLTESRLVDLKGLITHEFPLVDLAEAFALAAARGPELLKVIIRV